MRVGEKDTHRERERERERAQSVAQCNQMAVATVVPSSLYTQSVCL